MTFRGWLRSWQRVRCQITFIFYMRSCLVIFTTEVRQEQYQAVCSPAPLHFVQFTTSNIKQSARDRIKAASCSPEICPESSEFVVRIFSVTLSKITGLVVVNQFEVTGDFKSLQQPMRGMDSLLPANQRRSGSWRWQTCHWQEIKCQ